MATRENLTAGIAATKLELTSAIAATEQKLTSAVGAVKHDLHTTVVWALLLYFGLAAALLGAMARGFGWI